MSGIKSGILDGNYMMTMKIHNYDQEFDKGEVTNLHNTMKWWKLIYCDQGL